MQSAASSCNLLFTLEHKARLLHAAALLAWSIGVVYIGFKAQLSFLQQVADEVKQFREDALIYGLALAAVESIYENIQQVNFTRYQYNVVQPLATSAWNAWRYTVASLVMFSMSKLVLLALLLPILLQYGLSWLLLLLQLLPLLPAQPLLPTQQLRPLLGLQVCCWLAHAAELVTAYLGYVTPVVLRAWKELGSQGGTVTGVKSVTFVRTYTAVWLALYNVLPPLGQIFTTHAQQQTQANSLEEQQLYIRVQLQQLRQQQFVMLQQQFVMQRQIQQLQQRMHRLAIAARASRGALFSGRQQ